MSYAISLCALKARGWGEERERRVRGGKRRREGGRDRGKQGQRQIERDKERWEKDISVVLMPPCLWYFAQWPEWTKMDVVVSTVHIVYH